MSFFSFQDIISCVTGLMVLVTLLLALELTNNTGKGNNVPAVRQSIENAVELRDRIKAEVESKQKMVDKASHGVVVTETQVQEAEKKVRTLAGANSTVADQVATVHADLQRKQETERFLHDEVAAMEEAIARMQEQLDRKRKQPKVTLIQGTGVAKKALWVECSEEECLVTEIPEQGEKEGLAQEIRRFSGADSHSQLVAWARQDRDASKEYFVILVRPGAVEKWRMVIGGLKRLGFDVGWDVWPAGKNLLVRS